jgi:hypothetical protein
MLNIPTDYNIITTNPDDDFEQRMKKNLLHVTIMTVVLACSRLLSLSIGSLLGDLIVAGLIYATSIHQNKFTATFCMLTGVLGIVSSVFGIISAFVSMTIGLFNIISIIKFLITIYSLLVYALICYFAYVLLYEKLFKPNPVILASIPTYGAIDVEVIKNIKLPELSEVKETVLA